MPEEKAEFQQARCAVDVVAGVLPGTPEDDLTRRFWISSKEWNDADDAKKTNLLCDIAGKASAYSTFLMLQPERFNWVQTSWVWF